jgi:4-amino-4-deoxy-L-arabinose transferase-like glycosyltransferase
MWEQTLGHARPRRPARANALGATGQAVLVLIAIAAWLAATAWWRPLALPDEGRYVGVAWEMLHSRDWLVPTLDGLPFFHKPPLWYWLTAAAMSAFGAHEFAARLASMLGATLAAWTLYLFVRCWVGEARARTVLIVLLTMPLYFGGAQYANHDMLVAAFVTMAILAAAHAVLLREAGAPWGNALLAAYAVAALGVLTKGLIGAVLPALVFASWSLATRRTRALALLAWWPGWLLFGLIAAPWFVAMQARHDGFLDYFFVVQHFKRYAVGGFNNERDWWFYGAALALLTLRRGYFARGPQRDLRVLMALWALVVVVFFSLPRSKLVGYVLPALPALAFAVAEVVAASAVRLTAGIAAVACVAIVTGVGIAAPHSIKPAVAIVRDQMSSGDRVLMLDGYFYDLAFYLRRNGSAAVASDWAGVTSRDGWRHELLDAAAFDRQSARRVLIPSDEATAWLCDAGTTWIFGDVDAAQQHRWLTQAQAVYRDRSAAVWRWPAASTAPIDCH